jgi:Fe-S-cluster containining protein
MSEKPPVAYDCTRCMAYCCSIYERVAVEQGDLRRLARHFGLTMKAAEARFTKRYGKERILRRKKDAVLGRACRFLDPETRGCTIYEARPEVCRDYPGRSRCGYYDVLQFERKTQEDPSVVPLIQITFQNRKRGG